MYLYLKKTLKWLFDKNISLIANLLLQFRYIFLFAFEKKIYRYKISYFFPLKQNIIFKSKD